MSKKKKSAWRIWALALGRKEGRSDYEADRIAIIRTLIMIQLIVTNFFIIAGNVKNLFFDTTPVTVQQEYTKS